MSLGLMDRTGKSERRTLVTSLRREIGNELKGIEGKVLVAESERQALGYVALDNWQSALEAAYKPVKPEWTKLTALTERIAVGETLSEDRPYKIKRTEFTTLRRRAKKLNKRFEKFFGGGEQEED